MFAHDRSSRALTSALLSLLYIGLGGCGSVGPSHRAEKVSGETAFLGTQCEPGLVFECEPLCMRGDMDACQEAGLGYLAGTTVSQDLKRARLLLDRACASGRALACSAYAKMSADAQGVNLTPERETTLLQLGCDRGDVNACWRVGKRLLDAVEQGSATSDQAQSAHALLGTACDAGEVNACLELGLSAKSGRGGFPRDLRTSAKWLGQACAGDVGAACYELATLQAQPGSILADPIRARQNYDAACKLRTGAACAALAEIYAEGRNVTRNIARARELHEISCELEQVASCHALGSLSLSTDPRGALDNFAQACRAGVASACLEEGKLWEGRTPGVEPDQQVALDRYAKACSSNVAEACAYAGLLTLQSSKVVREDGPKVAQWLDRGCNEARVDDACLVYGSWLAQGEAKLKQDGKKAAELLGPLCQRALSEPTLAASCQELGRVNEHGIGMPRNVAGAATVYAKGCQAGHAASCLSEALLTWNGAPGVKRDPERAAAVFKRQCDQDDVLSCVHLGYAQQLGQGTARDLDGARNHFERACERGMQIGCAYLGQFHLTVSTAEDDRKKGEQLLRSACDSANGYGCLFLAREARVPPARQKELLKRACLLQVTEACTSLER